MSEQQLKPWRKPIVRNANPARKKSWSKPVVRAVNEITWTRSGRGCDARFYTCDEAGGLMGYTANYVS